MKNERIPAVGRSKEVLILDVDEVFSVPNHLDVGLRNGRVYQSSYQSITFTSDRFADMD